VRVPPLLRLKFLQRRVYAACVYSTSVATCVCGGSGAFGGAACAPAHFFLPYRRVLHTGHGRGSFHLPLSRRLSALAAAACILPLRICAGFLLAWRRFLGVIMQSFIKPDLL